MRDSAQLLQVIHAGMVSAGLDVNAIYNRLGYDAERMDLRQLRTPHQQQVFFWQTVETVTGDPDIGLHLCAHLPVYRGEVLEYLMFSSPTFADGAARVFKYLRLVSDALDVRLQHGNGTARLLIQSSTETAPALRHTEICTTYEIIRFAQEVSEQQFRAQEVHLQCERRSDPSDYARVFGCPVRFDAPQTLVSFDPAILAYRSPRNDPDLLQLHQELAEKRLSSLQRQDLIERIRQIFAQRLELEQCDLEEVAVELGISARRLRFELTRAGTSFSQLLAEFRFSLARRLLAETTEPIENIVYLTGFSEPSTFYRAFKRWAGMTPVQYRNSRARPAVAGEADTP
jgi:AraC-like DNA-binding protein